MLDEKNYDDDFIDEMELDIDDELGIDDELDIDDEYDIDDELGIDDELDKDDEYDNDKDKEPLSGNDIENQDDFEVWNEFFQ